MHTVPYEGSVGLVNLLTATRLVRKGFDVTVVLYGPGVLMASGTRGWPAVGDRGHARQSPAPLADAGAAQSHPRHLETRFRPIGTATYVQREVEPNASQDRARLPPG